MDKRTQDASVDVLMMMMMMMMMMIMMMMISKFNGTSTLKGSYSAKAGVNCPMSLNRVH